MPFSPMIVSKYEVSNEFPQMPPTNTLDHSEIWLLTRAENLSPSILKDASGIRRAEAEEMDSTIPYTD